MRYRDEPVARQDIDRDYQERTTVSVPHDSHQPPKDARQFTPDQILDETYGRLSPRMNDRNHYRPTYREERRRPVARNEWPEEQVWSPRQTVGEQAGQAAEGQMGWDEYDVPPFQQAETGQGEG